MKSLLALALLIPIVSTSAWCEERKLSGPEITTLLSDVVLTAEGDISQIFQKQGVTYYSENGGQSLGYWKVLGDQYCSQWPPNQSWPCYDVLQDAKRVTFISAQGQRTEMLLP